MMRLGSTILALVVCFLVFGARAGTEKTQIDLASLATAANDAEIVVSGRNEGDHPVVIVVRLDDAQSTDYWSRVNIERRVPGGPFTFRLPVSSLRTPGGRAIDRASLRRAFVFGAGPSVTVDRAIVELFPPLTSANGPIIALDFGPEGSPVFPGFERATPDDSRLEGKSFTPRSRPGPDALIGDGIEGVEALILRPGQGRWRVRIWTDDPGEWEYLPHARERRIRVNGQTVLERRMSPATWTERIYLAGREAEWQPGEGPWDAFGARRGGAVDATVETSNGEIRIEFAGSGRSATFISAILVTPQSDPQAIDLVENRRRLRFEETWRVANVELSVPPPSVLPNHQLIAAAGTPAILNVTVRSDEKITAPNVMVKAPNGDDRDLPFWSFVGHWRLTRPDTAATLLVPDDRHLRGDGLHLPIRPGQPRRYTLVVPIPKDAKPGPYKGSISIADQRHTFTIEVPDVDLPPADASVGLYLEDLPTHRWFRTDPVPSRTCAMSTLRILGLTGIAPPLTTPKDPDGERALIEDAALAKEMGFASPMLAYTPLKRLQNKSRLNDTERHLKEDGPALVWSAADEISNHGGAFDALRRHLSDIRAQAPGIELAGHLNAARDSEIADAFDMVLVNSGYELTAARIEALKRRVARVSLYNLDRPRLAAGAYLWRMGLAGYLQWHARMPTADPFDPTDGREADVAWLPPTPGDCPDTPDIDAELLDMAEGITDLRWLRWLALQASQNARAKALHDDIRTRLSGDWVTDKRLTNKHLQEIRDDIIRLAHGLRQSG